MLKALLELLLGGGNVLQFLSCHGSSTLLSGPLLGDGELPGYFTIKHAGPEPVRTLLSSARKSSENLPSAVVSPG